METNVSDISQETKIPSESFNADKPRLRTFFPAFGLPDPSPFPMKVMAFMRLHDIEFDQKPGDVRKAPLGKIPFLEHKGKRIPDSELIMDYLEIEYDLPKDNLTAEQHGIGHMICRTLEERSYWVAIYSRWIENENWPIMREKFFAPVPRLLRSFIANKVRKGVMRSMEGQGLGRHSREQIYDFARRDFAALSALLADKAYLFGEEPTRYDCTALPFIAGALQTELPTELPAIVNNFPNLIDYWSRGKKRLFE